ncbi:HAD family hydrolase [Aliidiomarina minuta]|uniref:HAD family hydrolase n=1 Tax=Aliidiomarina minuta TaxID=880057 RepID=A0A432WAK1_9GAMM|nr:GMP/IMP nucleotidase [Aliidiomarina minuta]RUO27144.1 HAD family hydrolase [Aliidiomarina minuta]
MLNWSQIDTLLLDMDGTLLDLHYDNRFWIKELPQHYAAYHGLPEEEAAAIMQQQFAKVAGTLNWYCLDYWQETLQLPVRELKQQLTHLIRMREDVPAFLTAARQANKRIVLVTNAHPDALALKNLHTQLQHYCDIQYSTHEFGACKEDQQLWQKLQHKERFDPKRSLFIDDGEHILDAAAEFGIEHLLGVANPDSTQLNKAFSRYRCFDNYHSLLPIITN